MAAFNIDDTNIDLASLIDRAARGEEIILTKNGRAVARLVHLASEPAARQPGRWRGKVWIADDFDAPLPADILRAFEGDSD